MMIQRLSALSFAAAVVLSGCGGGSSGGASTGNGTDTGGGSGGSKATVLSIKVVGTGTVTSSQSTSSCTSDCSQEVPTSTTVTLTATPSTGFTFAGWEGGCDNTVGNTCTVTLAAAANITATFLAQSAKSACENNFYAANFSLASAVTSVVDAIGTSTKPKKNVPFADPFYKTCVTRSTDHTADGVAGFTRNDYSRRQAFNADSSMYVVYALDGGWHVYNSVSRSRLKKLSGPGGDAEVQWSATNPDKLYFLPTNGVGMKINELTVSTNTYTTVGDLGARLKAKWAGANAAWTKSEGSPSKDGRYWCLMVDDANWKSLGVVTWDRDTNTLLGSISTNGDRPDHVSMSPTGNYCVVSYTSDKGTVAYSRDLTTSRKILSTSEHSDMAIDTNGDDAFVSVDYAGAGDVFSLNLRTGERISLFNTYISGTARALHISGRAFNKPGWVVVSTYAEYGGAKQWLDNKVFAVELKASPKIYNLAFHHSVSNGYWTEPHATVNRDFTKVLFNSNWDINTDTDVDAYMIEIPAGSLK